MTQTHPAVAARRRRIHTLRARVAAGAVALFIALFSGLYVQMASGHDPALSRTSSAQVAPTATATDSASSTSTDQTPMVTQAS
jgi:hypothetical protein